MNLSFFKFNTVKPGMFLALASLLQMQFARAQVSISLETGYAFPWAVEDIHDGNVIYFEDGKKEVEVFKTSHGAGKHFSLTIDHPIASNMQLGCRISYLQGAESGDRYKNVVSEGISTYSGQMLWITPQISFRPLVKRFSPYITLGPSIGLFGEVHFHQKINSAGNSFDSKIRYSKGVSWGMSSGLGFEYSFTKDSKWKLLAEMRLISASYGPKRADVVKWNVNGADLLGTLTLKEKAVVYKKKYIKDDSIDPDPNTPTTSTIEYYPFSNLGLNVGIKYTL